MAGRQAVNKLEADGGESSFFVTYMCEERSTKVIARAKKHRYFALSTKLCGLSMIDFGGWEQVGETNRKPFVPNESSLQDPRYFCFFFT